MSAGAGGVCFLERGEMHFGRGQRLVVFDRLDHHPVSHRGEIGAFGMSFSLKRVCLLIWTSTVVPFWVLTSRCFESIATTVPNTCWPVPWAKAVEVMVMQNA